MAFKDRLIAAMGMAGVDQSELARRVGVTSSAVNLLIGMVKVGVLTKAQATAIVDLAGLDLATHIGGNSPEMIGATSLIETVYLAVENSR